jgi:NADH:flavin oxidoreductase / NADH oxidase family
LLEIIETVRAAWPAGKQLSVRISSVDGVEGGLELADQIAFAREAKARGVDLIDYSSGGLLGSATAAPIPRGYGFQVPYADKIQKQADIATIAVGLILHPQQAEDILAQGHARYHRDRTRSAVRSELAAARATRARRRGWRSVRLLAEAIRLVAGAPATGPAQARRAGAAVPQGIMARDVTAPRSP